MIRSSKKNISKAFLALLAVLVGSSAPAIAQSSAHKLPTIPFEKYKLKNGLEVILSEDHTLPMVAVNLWYHVGPANERAGPHRLRAPLRAHDVPGLEARRRRTPAFQVSSKAPAPAASTAPPTSTAPTTSRRSPRISWSWRCGWNPTAWAICSTSSTVPQLANQQDVVRNERRQSVENRPYGMVEEARRTS